MMCIFVEGNRVVAFAPKLTLVCPRRIHHRVSAVSPVVRVRNQQTKLEVSEQTHCRFSPCHKPLPTSGEASSVPHSKVQLEPITVPNNAHHKREKGIALFVGPCILKWATTAAGNQTKKIQDALLLASIEQSQRRIKETLNLATELKKVQTEQDNSIS